MSEHAETMAQANLRHASAVVAYWLQQGKPANVRIVEDEGLPAVRSDMVGGRPR